MVDTTFADSTQAESTLFSHEGKQYELMWGIACEGPFVELWECQDREAEDVEAKLLYSYWLNDKGILTFQKHQIETSCNLEAIFVDEAGKLVPLLSEKVSQLPSPVRWLYQATN